MALFVPLDASYAQDPKVLDLDDERSELLYVRSLAYCKAHLTDGLIHRRALHQLAPCADDVSPQVLVADLVRVGLWVESDRGWRVVAWLKHNPGSEEILTPSKGRELAHQRHHVKTGNPKEGCPFCFPPEEPQVAAHDAEAMRCVDAVRDAQHALPEPEPQPESESKPPRSISEIPPVAEQTIRRTAALIGRERAKTEATSNPDGLAASITARILTGPLPDDRDLIAQRLTAGETPEAIAATWTPVGLFGERPEPDHASTAAAERARNLEADTAARLAAMAAPLERRPLAEIRSITGRNAS